jgi:CelD/BcsL family acetyltransferase involved in cellulose biosynthesis
VLVAVSDASGGIDAFLAASGQNTGLMTPAMTGLLVEVFGFEVRWLVSMAYDGAIRGAMPCFLLGSLLFGRRIVTAPFNFFGAGAAIGIEALSDLLEQARQLAVGRRWIEIKATTPLPEQLVADFGLAPREAFLTYEVPLIDEDDLERRRQSRFREKLRSLWRRLGRSITVAPASDRADVKRFHRLLTREYLRKHRTLPLPLALFVRVWETLSPTGKVELLLLELDGRLAAGVYLFRQGEREIYQWGAYELDFAAMSPLALLLDEAMRRALVAGKMTFDLGLTARSHEGLRVFKSRWGAVERPMTWYYLLSPGERLPDVSYDRSFPVARSVIAVLPAGVASVLPPRVIRELA